MRNTLAILLLSLGMTTQAEGVRVRKSAVQIPAHSITFLTIE